MQHLGTIRDADLFPDIKVPEDIRYRLRVSVRAVAFDDQGNIPLLYSNVEKYHKLPGGGLEVGENHEQGLVRELQEEIGCRVEVLDEIGMIEEYRSKKERHSKSYSYLAKVVGDKGEPTFTDLEKKRGYRLVWVNYDEAIRLFETDRPFSYNPKFIQKRDLTILKATRELQN